MIPLRTVSCICVEGFDETLFRQIGLKLSITILQESGCGPEFVVWQEGIKKERSMSYKRAQGQLDNLLLASDVFHIFSVGVDGKRDYHRPYSYLTVDRSFKVNRFFIYCDKNHIEPLAALRAIFSNRYYNAYIYEDDVLDAPPAYFAGVDFVGELGEALKPAFKKPDRIEHWRNNLWRGLDPRLGYVTEIHETNIWSEATLRFPLGAGTVRSFLEQNSIGKVGSSCGKFMIQLNDKEQERLRSVFDAAKICLAGFDGLPSVDADAARRAKPITH